MHFLGTDISVHEIDPELDSRGDMDFGLSVVHHIDNRTRDLLLYICAGGR